MSEGAERVWAFRPSEVISDRSKIWGSVHRQDRTSLDRAFAHSAQHLTKVNMRRRVLPGGGDVRWIECRAAPKRPKATRFLMDS